ncbi:MAG TPA: DUF116 domain-containing protein [Planctomycetota bacterium]|nr:DUF116 domain-containing protein [Planctomycetota bacterium]
MDAFDRVVIGLNNLSVRARRPRVTPGQILVLLPSCLQAAACKQNVVGDLAECRRCGRCRIGPLLEACERAGVAVALARGGRRAAELARQKHIRAIVAVACEKELRAGILACLPKVVVALRNRRPHGPCTETDVDVAEVEKAIAWLTRPAAPRQVTNVE